MGKKLTLRMDEEVIEKIKQYASERDISVSKLASNYFKLLNRSTAPDRESLPPVVRSLRGALKDSDLDEEDYKRHLEEKHLENPV